MGKGTKNLGRKGKFITLTPQTLELKGYLNVFNEVGLDNIFETKCKEQLTRFDMEIKFRKAEEERIRQLEEEKKKKKGAKKK
jgi:hypothetical protein